MATFKAVKNRKQTAGALKNTLFYIADEEKTVYDGRDFCSGLHCVVQSSFVEMLETKEQFCKTEGRQYYQFIQSFHPEENVTPAQVHEMGRELAEKLFADFEVVVCTHCNTDHLHNHFLVNSVSFRDGHMLHLNHDDLVWQRKMNDEICLSHGLSTLAPYQKQERGQAVKSGEYQAALRGQSYKMALVNSLYMVLDTAQNKDDFIEKMNAEGYEVHWTASRKYITYVDEFGHRMRDKSLHDDLFLKENMEKFFGQRTLYGVQEHTQTENHFTPNANLMGKLGSLVEQTAEVLDQTPTHISSQNNATESKLLRREALKKLSRGQKIGGDEGFQWEMHL